MPRKSFDTLADNLHDVMVETLPTMVDKHIKEQVMKQVPEKVWNQVLVYVAEGLILERQKAKEETERLIAKAIMEWDFVADIGDEELQQSLQSIYYLDTMVAEVGTADSTGHTVAKCNQVGCRLPAVEHFKPQPYGQTLHDICPSDMTAYTPFALSHPDVSPYDPSYHINPAWMFSRV
ncbi:hypothetical protein Tco_0808527 [Tanacetum coccineum]